jgi:molybdopterin synthase sulfur carrier subunit
MKVKLLCFGITKDIIGSFEKEFELDSGTKVSAFLDKLKSEYPKLGQLASLRVAVNEEYADQEAVLEQKDEIVLIPPVSGG